MKITANVNSVRDSMKARPMHQEHQMPARVPGLRASASRGRANRFALSHAAKPGCDSHAEPDADRRHIDYGRAAIRKGRNGEAKRRQGHEHILKFPHSSPAPLRLAASGWLRLTVLAPSRLRPPFIRSGSSLRRNLITFRCQVQGLRISDLSSRNSIALSTKN